ncbi:3-hydroxyisobutyrate dehydrogenase [Rhodobacter sp. Har01]|uniref:3-hydroxyisobutyrate dehydrogenase n=1 Tax=Rhodobacter sp. Har01 TaxID=2883999 RepID=UPI001D0810A0|nr:3-hydroxyisobutyrate dehydrogenase [Rhodobacter sp. Har01]MCB6176937.1 3-hydroxyisobutyrate dehydrogenase [Rhodobacter sp. Har01]
MTVGFIGLGNMGLPMALNLVKAGFRVQGFDTTLAARTAAQAGGVTLAATAAEAARGAEAVVTMLPSGPIMQLVWVEVVPAMTAGALIVDCSTVDIDSCHKAHAMAAAAGLVSLDCPVSGGVGGATAATLTFMAGGSGEAYARAEPLLAAMGKARTHCGEAGAGQAAKICNNMILGISMIAVSEAFGLADRLGLSRQAMFDVASKSSGQCWSLTTYCPVPGPVPTSPANNSYKPGFAAALMLKDLRLSQAAATGAGANTPLGAAATQLYEAMDKAGQGNRDFSAIFEVLTGVKGSAMA